MLVKRSLTFSSWKTSTYLRFIKSQEFPGEPFRDKLGQLNNFYIPISEMIYKNYSEARATKYLKQNEVYLSIDVGVGKCCGKVYTCDLTHKYIEINADYRS